MTVTPAELYEVFVQWAAYQELHEVLGGDPRTSDPRDLIGKVAAYGHDRAAAAIVDSYLLVDIDDAELVLGELLDLAATGRRPRYGRELGTDFCIRLSRELCTPQDHEGATP